MDDFKFNHLNERARHSSAGPGLARLLVIVVATDTGQPGIAQPDWIALASVGGIDDPLGNDLVNDGWLPSVVQRLAGVVERLAQDFGHPIVKDSSGLPDKRQYRPQPEFLSRQDSHVETRPILHTSKIAAASFFG